MQETQEVELKPCPFCGGKAFISNYEYENYGNSRLEITHSIDCEKCCSSIGYCRSEEEAIETWNKRWLQKDVFPNIIRHLGEPTND